MRIYFYLTILATLLCGSVSAQSPLVDSIRGVLPTDFPIETVPNDLNFEIYSQKDGRSTRTTPSGLVALNGPDLTITGDNLLLVYPSGRVESVQLPEPLVTYDAGELCVGSQCVTVTTTVGSSDKLDSLEFQSGSAVLKFSESDDVVIPFNYNDIYSSNVYTVDGNNYFAGTSLHNLLTAIINSIDASLVNYLDPSFDITSNILEVGFVNSAGDSTRKTVDLSPLKQVSDGVTVVGQGSQVSPFEISPSLVTLINSNGIDTIYTQQTQDTLVEFVVVYENGLITRDTFSFAPNINSSTVNSDGVTILNNGSISTPLAVDTVLIATRAYVIANDDDTQLSQTQVKDFVRSELLDSLTSNSIADRLYSDANDDIDDISLGKQLPLSAVQEADAPIYSGDPYISESGIVYATGDTLPENEGFLISFRRNDIISGHLFMGQNVNGLYYGKTRGNGSTNLSFEDGEIATRLRYYQGRLRDKKLEVFGDSFSDNPSNDWISELNRVLGMQLNTNAVSGNRADQQNTILSNLISTTPTYFDDVAAVVILLGVNDWSQGTELGTWQNTPNSSTVCGQIKGMVEAINAANPLTEIYLVSPPDGTITSKNWVFGQNNTATIPWSLADLDEQLSYISYSYRQPFVSGFRNSRFAEGTITELSYDSLHPAIGTGTVALGQAVSWAMISKVGVSERPKSPYIPTATEILAPSSVNYPNQNLRFITDALYARSAPQIANDVEITLGEYAGLNVRTALDNLKFVDGGNTATSPSGLNTNDWHKPWTYGFRDREIHRGNETNGPASDNFAFYHSQVMSWGTTKGSTEQKTIVHWPTDFTYRTGSQAHPASTNVSEHPPFILLDSKQNGGTHSPYYQIPVGTYGGGFAISVDSLNHQPASLYLDAETWSTFPATESIVLGTNKLVHSGTTGIGFLTGNSLQYEAANHEFKFGSGSLNLAVAPNVWSFSGENGGVFYNDNIKTLTLDAGNNNFILNDEGITLPEVSTVPSTSGTLSRDLNSGRLIWYDADLVESSDVAMTSDIDPDHILLTTGTAISQITRNVFIDGTTNTTHPLSPAANFVDKYVTIMNVDAVFTVTLDPFSIETIDGGNLTITLAPNEAITITNFTGSTDIKVISRN